MKTTSSIQKSAKTAGLAYLLIIGTSILAMLFGPYKLIVIDDLSATINNIADGQSLFRIGMAYDLLMYIGVIILSVALYRVLKDINGATALTALISRTGEALFGSLSVVISVMILWFINRDMTTESARSTVDALFEIKDVMLNIVFAFLGFGSVLYSILFYKSRFIPRWLAVFGILAFALVFTESILILLFPFQSTMITGVPAILFEITIGCWLLIKGINSAHDSDPIIETHSM